jgi:hypothetical protein
MQKQPQRRARRVVLQRVVLQRVVRQRVVLQRVVLRRPVLQRAPAGAPVQRLGRARSTPD